MFTSLFLACALLQQQDTIIVTVDGVRNAMIADSIAAGVNGPHTLVRNHAGYAMVGRCPADSAGVWQPAEYTISSHPGYLFMLGPCVIVTLDIRLGNGSVGWVFANGIPVNRHCIPSAPCSTDWPSVR